MRFIDEVIITVSGGQGGSGAVSFHRAKYVPKGGPDGGDGGHGGSVILRASSQIGTLYDLQHQSIIRAKNGTPGQGSRKNGRKASDITIDIPVGTLVYDEDESLIIADLIEDGQAVTVAQGGIGGRGNSKFATPTNRAPRRFDFGRPGESRKIRLEMKLLADVGLVGRPNSGKSTLLSALTHATPVIGDYPFTTLTPGLGVVNYGPYQRFVIADIPGLAEGAAEGRGLGHQFLRHIERTRLLVLLIDTSDTDYHQSYKGIISELSGFSAKLTGLPRIVIRSKSDLPVPEIDKEKENKDFQFDHVVSSINGDGLTQFRDMIASRLGLVKEASS